MGREEDRRAFSARFARRLDLNPGPPATPVLCSAFRAPRGPSSTRFPDSLRAPRRIVRAPVTDDEQSSSWSVIRDELQRAVPESTWHQWLEPLTGRQQGDGRLLVEAPPAQRPWVAKRFGRLLRECAEELGCEVEIRYLSGVYSHSTVQSHAFIFRCNLPEGVEIQLSSEHSEYGYFRPEELPPVQHRRVSDCLEYDGRVRSARF
jgi:hypothetical protein